MKTLIEKLKAFRIYAVMCSFILESRKKYHRFWKMIYWNYHPHNYFSDGFVKHYNKLKELEPDKWS